MFDGGLKIRVRIDLPYGKSLARNSLCHLDLELGRGKAKQGPGMPHGKAMLDQKKLDIPGQAQEPQHVSDGRAILARALCNLFVAEFVVACQALERVGNLNRVEVLALDILDER